MTDDGSAAVTSDARGGIRLWPRLDGTREPIVLHGHAPDALAIAADGDGFAIADRDSVGNAELIRVAANGVERGRTSLAGDPAIADVVLTSHGAIVARVDQSLELVDTTGAPHGRLVPDPGVRIRALVQRSGRVLALLEHGDVVRGRWVEVDGGALAWGTETVPLSLDPARPIALAPDHRHVAGRGRYDVVAIDLATGKTSHTPCDDVIAFVDARTTACTSVDHLVWWAIDDQPIAAEGNPVITTFIDIVAGGTALFASHDHAIAIITPERRMVLGYRMRNVTSARVAGDGAVVGDATETRLVLDAHFHERMRFALTKPGHTWTDAYPLDDRYVLTAEALPPPDRATWGGTYQLAVFDTAAKAVHQLIPARADKPEIAFEPATGLLVAADGATTLLLRYDPLTHAFAERIAIKAEALVRRVVLLDPARADGLIALAIHGHDNDLVVDELHGDDVRAGTLAPRSSYRVPGALISADRAGDVYVHRVMDADAVAIYRHGAVVATVPGIADQTLVPSDDGAFVAAFKAPNVTLATTRGVVLWHALTWDATGLAWTAGGALYAQFSGALAKLDLTTGAPAERQCGWAFELSEYELSDATPTTPSICDVAP